jgi:hypothetical protein
VTDAADPSLVYLYAKLAALEVQVRAAIARRLEHDAAPDDRFRGLYISDAEVERLLAAAPVWSAATGDPGGHNAAAEEAADTAEAAGREIRLRRLVKEFGLDDVDVALLLVALAPDLDARFERLYGYINDDVSRRRATTGLALEFCGLPSGTAAARGRLSAGAPLIERRLVEVEEPERPFLTRLLVVPDRVTAYLLGDDRLHPDIEDLATDPVDVGLTTPGLEQLEGCDLWYLRERPGSGGMSLATSALRRAGRGVLALDLERLAAGADLPQVAAAAGREAGLGGAGLVAGPVEILAARGPEAVRAFADLDCPVVLLGSRAWDPSWSRRIPLLLSAPLLAPDDRARMWHAALGDRADGVDFEAAVGSFWLSPEQAGRAGVAALRQARAHGRAPTGEDIRAGARAQNAAGLERLARRILPQMGWPDLVLPGEADQQLHELASRARHRDTVLDEWGMGATASRGRGVTALFAGDSGTGKTMSAEVLAGDLGLELYVIDLSSVVDKYIGETEKNLDRIFAEADRVNGVLLFDEADALFGKRSEVSDARDRYANVEVAYLLQRMEQFDGVAILTTNLRANLDEAFTRRLDAIIDFPAPEERHRFLLWERNLPASLPQTSDIDIAFLAAAFQLSGGEIRNIAVTAAYLAAEEGEPVAMSHVIRGTEREYRKLGRMCVPAEFGSYYELLDDFDDEVAQPLVGLPAPA